MRTLQSFMYCTWTTHKEYITDVVHEATLDNGHYEVLYGFTVAIEDP